MSASTITEGHWIIASGGNPMKQNMITVHEDDSGVVYTQGDKVWKEADALVVELVDNELRAFLADMARLGRNTDSLRLSIGPRGLRLQVDGGRWTPACGHVDTREQP